MTGPDPKAELLGYLQAGREALPWKLDGLSEYDIRRPRLVGGACGGQAGTMIAVGAERRRGADRA